jgi:hypothetical protein
MAHTLFANATTVICDQALAGDWAATGVQIAGAEWHDLELEASSAEWTIPGACAKSGVTHFVPLTASAAASFKIARLAAPESPCIWSQSCIEIATPRGRVSR